MLDYDGGRFAELDLGFTPSPSGGGMSVLQQEEVHDAFVLMFGYAPSMDAREREEAIALITVEGVSQTVFGYPNEEAFWLDDRGDVGHGVYELEGSKWQSNMLEYNQRTFGSRHPTWELSGKFESPRHFFVGSSDVSAQFLAEGVRLESFSNMSYTAVRDMAMRRIDQWHDWNDQGRPIDPRAGTARSFPGGLA